MRIMNFARKRKPKRKKLLYTHLNSREIITTEITLILEIESPNRIQTNIRAREQLTKKIIKRIRERRK